MTPPERLVAGLDIGSAKTTAIIAEVVGDLPKHPTIKVLGVGQARTTGMRRGVVSDIEETTRSIRKALQERPMSRWSACRAASACSNNRSSASSSVMLFATLLSADWRREKTRASLAATECNAL